jgi:hypothetical protein
MIIGCAGCVRSHSGPPSGEEPDGKEETQSVPGEQHRRPEFLQGVGVPEERDAHSRGEHDDRPRGGDRNAARSRPTIAAHGVNHPAYWREKAGDAPATRRARRAKGRRLGPPRATRVPSTRRRRGGPRAPAPSGDLVNSIRLASGRRRTAQRDDNCGYPEAGARVRDA